MLSYKLITIFINHLLVIVFMGTRKEHKREIRFHRGRHRKDRAKTFKTEAQAKAWAQKEGIKSFDVVRLNHGLSRKLTVVAKK